MNNTDSPLKNEDYQFIFERILRKIPYSLKVFLLFVLPTLTWFLLRVYFLTITTEFNLLWPYFLNEIKWILPGTISSVLIAYLLKYSRNRTIENIDKINPLLEEPATIQNLLKSTFSTKAHFLFPLSIAVFALIFQLVYLIFSPWPWWQVWYNQNYMLNLVTAIDLTLSTALTYYVIGVLGYFCLAELYLVYRIGKSLKPLEIIEFESGKLSPINSEILTISLSWSIGVGILLAISPGAPIVWWTVLQIALFSIVSIVFFVLPQFFIHKQICSICRAKKLRIREQFWNTYENIQKLEKTKISYKQIVFLNAKLSNLELAKNQIEDLPKWTFERTDLLKVLAVISTTSAFTVLTEQIFKVLFSGLV